MAINKTFGEFYPVVAMTGAVRLTDLGQKEGSKRRLYEKHKRYRYFRKTGLYPG